jgi:hypothetical protein
MDLHWYLGAYWKLRKESGDECAARIQKFFAGLATIDTSVANWYETAKSRAEALTKHADVTDAAYLSRLLTSAKFREPNLGYLFCLWNGARKQDAIGVSITCGSNSQWSSNAVVINLPKELGAFALPDKMIAVLSTVVRAWEPEWAGVQSQKAVDLRHGHMDHPFVDWMVYLSRDLLRDGTTLHQPARVVALGSLGAIVITQPEPPDPTNPEHVANVERVRLALGL